MKATFIAILVSVVIIGGAILFATQGSSSQGTAGASANNVNIIDGTQVIEISVKGGYHPQKSVAQAGIPTILRFKTKGTYDCSSSIRIPSLGVSQFLPPSGNTDIALGTPKAGTLSGTCGMGMYSFSLEFSV